MKEGKFREIEIDSIPVATTTTTSEKKHHSVLIKIVFLAILNIY